MVEHDEAMVRARQRASDLKEFYVHLLTYVLVNTLLVVIDIADGSAGTSFMGLNWAYWPIFGWGIAIVIHAVKVFVPLSGWEERKAAQIYEREQRRRM